MNLEEWLLLDKALIYDSVEQIRFSQSSTRFLWTLFIVKGFATVMLYTISYDEVFSALFIR